MWLARRRGSIKSYLLGLNNVYRWIPKLLDEIFAVRACWAQKICQIGSVLRQECVIQLGREGGKVHRHSCSFYSL
jgi:hypothetical protein